MNNQQLIKAFPPLPKHSIHRVQPSRLFNRWLTFTAQLPTIGGQRWDIIRLDVLGALYEDWERYRADATQGPHYPPPSRRLSTY